MSLRDFEIVSKLGSGTFSSVYKVLKRSVNRYYALKKSSFRTLSQREKENALNEVRVLASLDHPNIVDYKEAFFDDDGQNLCIVMELAEHGDLLQKINEHKRRGSHFPEFEVWEAIMHITSGLQALHNMKILHRDLKCANIFVGANQQYKLGDLNVSKINENGLAYTQTGTPYYASPEVWKGQAYNASSDIWSLGCVIYEMVSLSPPFTAKDMEGLYRKVIRGDYPRIPTLYSRDLSSIIAQMLQTNPRRRLTCSQILQSPLLTKNCAVKSGRNGSVPLLGTIKFSSNIRALEERLPAARYEKEENQKRYQNGSVENRMKPPMMPRHNKQDTPYGRANRNLLLEEQFEREKRLRRVKELMNEQHKSPRAYDLNMKPNRAPNSDRRHYRAGSDY